MDLVNKLVVFTSCDIFRLSFSVFVKKSPLFQKVDIFPELDRCTPCVFIGLGTVARFSRNKSLLISFGAPVVECDKNVKLNICNHIACLTAHSI